MLLLMTFDFSPFVPPFTTVVAAAAADAGQKWLLLAHATKAVRRHSVSLFLCLLTVMMFLYWVVINQCFFSVLRQAVCLSELVWSGTDGRLLVGGDGVS